MTALEFETLHEPRWAELERWTQAKQTTLRPAAFLALYRQCCEHLVMAQSRGFPPHVIERLSSVTSRAHQIIYRQNDFGASRISHALLNAFPAAVYAQRRFMIAAALLLLVPTVAMGLAVYLKPDLILNVVGGQTASQFERMYGPAAESIGRTRDANSDWGMFGFYIMNNIGIAFQCFATGVAFGLGSLWFLIMNGVFGGAIAGYVTALGYGARFYSFVVTHSAFELTAIVLSGGSGLRIGMSVLFPGRVPRMAALQTAAHGTSVIVFGAAVMLVIAAFIEAFWSSAVWVDPLAKYAFAAACWFLVILFFVRRARAS